MKRDLLAMCLGICLMLGLTLYGTRDIVPASMTVSQPGPPILIIDAGHGGEDGGAVSAGGNRESSINLAVALKLEQLLAFCGTDAQMTRTADISLHSDGCTTIREKKVSDLKNRVSMVNSVPNAMLISVHQNHFTDPRYSGAQVFYHPDDTSRQWGERTQEVLRQILDVGNGRKAKVITAGSVYLFEHIDCPSILVECGFLSNGEEASLLMTDGYQRKIALALAGAYLHQLQIMPIVPGGD